MIVFVCIKQVPGTVDVKIDSKTGTLIRDNIPAIINPLDKHAIEAALQVKDKNGAETIAISMGPPQAEEALREALAMGIDKACLLTDKAFAGADTLATSYTIAQAIKKCLSDTSEPEKYLVLCGTQAIDGDTAQVGAEVAEELGIPHISYTTYIEVNDGTVVAQQTFSQDEIAVLEAPLPVLATVTKEINMPRLPAISSIVAAYDKKKIIKWNAVDIGAEKTKIGYSGSRTQVWKIFSPQKKTGRIQITGTAEEIAQQLCKSFKDEKFI
jgi:electron transfer flavoprotein alpha/beta subunit